MISLGPMVYIIDGAKLRFSCYYFSCLKGTIFPGQAMKNRIDFKAFSEIRAEGTSARCQVDMT